MGHPAVANLPNGEHVNEFKNKYNITEEEQVLALLPGSRVSEVNRLNAPFLETVSLLEEKKQRLRVFIPAVPHIRDKIEASLKQKASKLDGFQITLIEGEDDKLGLWVCDGCPCGLRYSVSRAIFGRGAVCHRL